MKIALGLVLILVVSFGYSIAYSSESPVAVGVASVFNSAKSYEIVIDGSAAQKLYETLDVTARPVGTWLNKNSRGIVCGQNSRTSEYSCSISVDEAGVQ